MLGDVLPENHWKIPMIENALAMCMAEQGRRDEAERLMEKSCGDLEARLGAEDYRTTMARTRTAAYFENQGLSETALEYK